MYFPFFQAILAGLLGTLLMDLGALLGMRLGLVTRPNPALLGRWVLGISQGHFRVPDIRQVPVRHAERPVGLAAHYGIGLVLGTFYFLLCAFLGLPPDSFAVAVTFGMATNVLPWFVMYPALGFGVLGRRAPPEAKLLPTSLLAHFNFGVGIWVLIRLLALYPA